MEEAAIMNFELPEVEIQKSLEDEKVTITFHADGKQYDSMDAAKSAGATNIVTATPIELAAQFMMDAVDMGVPADVARAKAMAKWPEAFTATDDADDADATPDAG